MEYTVASSLQCSAFLSLTGPHVAGFHGTCSPSCPLYVTVCPNVAPRIGCHTPIELLMAKKVGTILPDSNTSITVGV